MIKKQSIEEWIQAGGYVNVCKKQKSNTTTTTGDFIKKDVELKALRKLKKTVDDSNNHAHNMINEAIRVRLVILKH